MVRLTKRTQCAGRPRKEWGPRRFLPSSFERASERPKAAPPNSSAARRGGEERARSRAQAPAQPFDDLPVQHLRRACRKASGHAQVVRDEQDREAEARADGLQE